MEKIPKLHKAYRATEDETEVRAILIGMPRAHLSDVTTQFALLGNQILSGDDQVKLQLLELPRYEYVWQTVPSLVTGPGVDLTAVLPVEILMKVIKCLPPVDCLRLSESSKIFHQILKEESFWSSYCDKLLPSAFKDEYKTILDRSTLSSKRLALLVFGKREPISIYSDWEKFQRIQRSKNDAKLEKELKKEMKKGKFQKIVRFDTFNAHNFEIRLTNHDYVHYIFIVNLLEFDWQIEDEQGIKGYLQRCADSINKFCENELEEKKKLAPKKKEKLVSVQTTILYVGFDTVQSLQEKIAQKGSTSQFTSMQQVTEYFNSLLDNTAHPIRPRHLLALGDANNVRIVYHTMLDTIYSLLLPMHKV